MRQTDLMSHYSESMPVRVCRYCKADPLARTATPEFLNMSVSEYHSSAKCVEGDEPSYKMGGPA